MRRCVPVDIKGGGEGKVRTGAGGGDREGDCETWSGRVAFDDVPFPKRTIPSLVSPSTFLLKTASQSLREHMIPCGILVIPTHQLSCSHESLAASSLLVPIQKKAR